MAPDTLYYVACVFEQDHPALRAGMDLLGGPYQTADYAAADLARLRRLYHRWETTRLLALADGQEHPPVFRVVPVTRAQVDAYNARHADEEGLETLLGGPAFRPVAWPPAPIPCGIPPKPCQARRDAARKQRRRASRKQRTEVTV